VDEFGVVEGEIAVGDGIGARGGDTEDVVDV
jgi:hypothetical protein